MKHPLRYVAYLSLALLAWGCNRFDDPVVIEGVGNWNIVNKVTQVTKNGVMILDSTASGNLGTYSFERSGRALLRYPSNQLDTLTWEDYPKENRFIMYHRRDAWMNCEVVNRTDKAMTLHWENASAEGTVQYLRAYTMEIVRVE